MPSSARFLSTVQAAAYLCVTERALAHWRKIGVGPPYLRHGENVHALFSYPVEGLHDWVRQHTVTPATDYAVPDAIWASAEVADDRAFAEQVLDLAAFGLPWSSASDDVLTLHRLREKAADWFHSGKWFRLLRSLTRGHKPPNVPFRLMIQVALVPWHQGAPAGPGLVLTERPMVDTDRTEIAREAPPRREPTSKALRNTLSSLSNMDDVLGPYMKKAPPQN